jgi:anti-sigma regulatory factor (Ser/Thr protein kinase)
LIRLAATHEATRRAREKIESLPELSTHLDLQFVAALLTTELVTNSLRHAQLDDGEEITVHATCSADTVHVQVSDRGPGFNPLKVLRSRTGDPPHHGCNLINTLADRWGFRRSHLFCCVWFEIDLVPGRRPWRGRELIRNNDADR